MNSNLTMHVVRDSGEHGHMGLVRRISFSLETITDCTAECTTDKTVTSVLSRITNPYVKYTFHCS